MKYPYRDSMEEDVMKRLPSTHYAEDDLPYLSIARYSISPDYDPRDVAEKKSLDTSGAQENWYWYNQRKGIQ